MQDVCVNSGSGSSLAASCASAARSAAAVFDVAAGELDAVCDCGVIVKDGGRFTACNVQISGCNSFGVRAQDGASFVLESCDITRCAAAGVCVVGSGSEGSLGSTRIAHCGDGVMACSGSTLTAVACAISRCSHAASLGSGSSSIIDDCVLSVCFAEFIAVENGAFATIRCGATQACF